MVERYQEVFGGLDHNVTIGGVEFVFVDAQALDGDDHPFSFYISWKVSRVKFQYTFLGYDDLNIVWGSLGTLSWHNFVTAM